MTGAVKVWREADGRLLRLRLARPKANVIDSAMIGALDGALLDRELDGHEISLIRCRDTET